jgi:hypothetical protein
MNWQAWDIQPPPEGALVKFKDEITKLQWIGTSYDIGQESTKYLWWIKTGIQSMEDECQPK